MSAKTHHTTPTSGHCHRKAQKKESKNGTRGTAKSPWELKRGCGVAALLRRYCGERLLSGPAFWENGSRASALHMPLDICPQHVIPISKYTQVSSYWLLFHSRSILSHSVSKSSILFRFSLTSLAISTTFQFSSKSLSLSFDSLSIYWPDRFFAAIRAGIAIPDRVFAAIRAGIAMADRVFIAMPAGIGMPDRVFAAIRAGIALPDRVCVAIGVGTQMEHI